jgi:hypothetical protein
VRHRFEAHFALELPFGEGKRWATTGVGRALFGGWTLSIYAARSGRSFTVVQGSNNVGQMMTGLPNQIGDPQGAETVEQWFNPAAFQAGRSGTFGDVRRNSLRGPGWASTDLSVQRRIAATDRVGAILRWDLFNVFDRATPQPADDEHLERCGGRHQQPVRRPADHAVLAAPDLPGAVAWFSVDPGHVHFFEAGAGRRVG